MHVSHTQENFPDRNAKNDKNQKYTQQRLEAGFLQFLYGQSIACIFTSISKPPSRVS